jgi:5-methylcytosine-specific restriction endonuclease McrA
MRGTRCRACDSRHERKRDERRGTPSQRGYGARWYALSAAARQAQGWCSECGATSDLTADHVIPLARGGSSEWDNVIVLCRSCNGAKGARMAGGQA